MSSNEELGFQSFLNPVNLVYNPFMQPQTIIFIGHSGCGKGVQGELLKKYFQENDSAKREVFTLESGGGFREFIKGEHYTNKLSKDTYEKSKLQPDFLAIWVWANEFINNLTGEEHLMIDGTPRSLGQAMVLNDGLAFYGRRANIVHLDISPETSKQRLLERGRSDDVLMEKINRRLEWFDREVMPAISYLKSQSAHNYMKINGEQSIEKVHADIVAALKTEWKVAE